MPVCRLIFQINYKGNFDIIEKPGQVMRVLNDTDTGFWHNLGENVNIRTVNGNSKIEEEKHFRELSVSPNTIRSAIEHHQGIEINDLPTHDTIRKIIKITNALRKEFNIDELVRFGIRFFYFANLGLGQERIASIFNKLFDAPIVDAISNKLGSIDDSGIAFDGTHEDQVKYHFKCGPYFSKEASKYLKQFVSSFEKETEYDMVFDIDLYENNFNLNKDVSIIKWIEPALIKMNDIIEDTKRIILEKAE
jgi:hypothetical protein